MPTATCRSGFAALPAARLEVVLCLVRATVLLFGAAGLLLGETASPRQGTALALHVGAAVGWALLALPLLRSRSETAVRRAAVLSTAADVLLYAGYAAAFTGEPGLGTLYA